jgi:hypothetical protein
MSWGGTPTVTEFNARRKRTFRLELAAGSFSYRATPIESIGKQELRAGMDARARRGG